MSSTAPASGSFGKWMFAGLIVVMGVATLEYYDTRYAWGLAFVVLLTVFFRYPQALTEIAKIFHLGYGGTTPPERR